jgi:hypothetical protein
MGAAAWLSALALPLTSQIIKCPSFIGIYEQLIKIFWVTLLIVTRCCLLRPLRRCTRALPVCDNVPVFWSIVLFLSWRWRQQVPAKHRHVPTERHNTNISALTTGVPIEWRWWTETRNRYRVLVRKPLGILSLERSRSEWFVRNWCGGVPRDFSVSELLLL